MAITCLDKIIGLSKTTCPCLTQGAPIDAATSTSGYMLDELEYLSLDQMKMSEDCADGSMWQILADARDRAVANFPRDLMTVIMQNYKQRRQATNVTIGEPTFNGDKIIPVNDYAGQKITPWPIKGGYMTLKRFGLLLNQSVANVAFEVYDDFNNITSPLGSYTINTTANSVSYGALTMPLVLPMTRPDGYRIQYKFVYQKPAGAQPKRNGFTCLCGGRVVPYLDWVQVGGVNGPTLQSLSLNGIDNEANGVILDLEFRCAADELICSPMYPLTFDADGLGASFAKAIMFKAGEYCMDHMIKTPEINRYTMMGRDQMMINKTNYSKSYDLWLEYIAGIMDYRLNDCLICKENSIKQGRILT